MDVEKVSVSDKGKFVVIINEELMEYSDYDDIPDTFDKIIACEFSPLPEPHSEEDHVQMGTWNDKLQSLKDRQIG